MIGGLNGEDDDNARKALKIIDLGIDFQNWTGCFEKCKVPTIAVIHGYCIGFGLDLTTACDIMESKDECFKKALEITNQIVKQSPVAIYVQKNSLRFSHNHNV